MTPKTGKPRGRPTGSLGGGRPRGPVMNSPDRYLLARIAAEVARAEGQFTEWRVLKALVAVAIGQVVETEENRDLLRRGLPFAMMTLPGRLPPKVLNRDRVEEERTRDAFAPYLHDLQSQLRDLRKRKDARGDWHRTMVRVVNLAIVRDGQARELAESIGEGDVFDRWFALIMLRPEAERRAFRALLRRWGGARLVKHGARIIIS